MHLYPKKTFILMTFRSPSDAASILTNLKINAGTEPEIAIKLIENFFFFNLFSYLLAIYFMLILSCDAASIPENLCMHLSHFKKVVQMH